jgi:2-oxo-4-hydroxy-4-carboxy-5-ureidoimidazoline decarboxylase
MTLEELNALSPEAARGELARCCGSSRWVEEMLKRRPFRAESNLLEAAEAVWKSLSAEDWKEAFGHHPKIGDVKALREKFAATAAWAEGEQSSVSTATEDVLHALAEGNRQYAERFGYIFIVCATGKRADEMLTLLKERLNNDARQELLIAAGEQDKITKLRLQKLIVNSG